MREKTGRGGGKKGLFSFFEQKTKPKRKKGKKRGREKKSISFGHKKRALLQSLAGRSLRVDGEGELVHHHDQQEDDGGHGGGKGDVPAVNGAPVLGLGDDSVHVGGSNRGRAGGVGAGGVHKVAARAIHAGKAGALRVILEGLDDSNVHEESNDDGDDNEGAESHGHKAGQGHANSEDELVADAVKEECEEEGQQDESSDQGHEHESLRGLGDVAEVAGGGIVGEHGVGAAVDRGGGLHAVQVVVDLGLVDGG